jgi:hypothetical protein
MQTNQKHRSTSLRRIMRTGQTTINRTPHPIDRIPSLETSHLKLETCSEHPPLAAPNTSKAKRRRELLI